MTRLDPRQARRRYLVLLGLRWVPSGMLLPVLTLLPLERGLTLSELGLAAAVQGLVVFGLELPTGGLSDSLGRKPVLVASGVISLAAIGLFLVADTFVLFVIAFAVHGSYRALDTGPLEAWYVDTILAHDPDADVSTGLSRGGAVLGVSVGGGALTAGGLVALDPLPAVDALAVPLIAAIVMRAVSVAATMLWLTEVQSRQGRATAGKSVRAVPAVIVGSLRLLRGSVVLKALICVELFWGFGMITFESLTPIRLAEVVSDPDDAGALMGPATSVAWAASAAGAALVPILARRVGVALTAGAMRVLQGLTVMGMAIFAGPVGVVAAFLASYAVHGASNPMHMTLLHRQVTSDHRSTVISLNSMVSQPAGALGMIALTAVADRTSVSTALVVGAVVLALAAPLYLPARRAEKEQQPAAV